MTGNLLESPFAYGELFFSRTDLKGIIRAGNSVFQRVSGYPWEELLGKPHNRIRHPDMPRGVFYLLWKELKAARAVGAFVKNRSKDGRYYWVLALALPVDGGYVSVRMKPGGALLTTVAKEYEALRATELGSDITPEESCDLLLKRLASLGYPTYSGFMAEALTDQIANRCENLRRVVPPAIQVMRVLRDHRVEIDRHTKGIVEAYGRSKFVPLNLEASAVRMEERGRLIAVVADQYQRMAEGIGREMERFAAMAGQVGERIEQGQFAIGSEQLLRDVETSLAGESGGSNDGGESIARIKELSLRSAERLRDVILDIRIVISAFVSSCESLRNLSSSLELMRVVGKIENARHASADRSVDELLSTLKRFQSEMDDRLSLIVERNRLLDDSARSLFLSLPVAGR